MKYNEAGCATNSVSAPGLFLTSSANTCVASHYLGILLFVSFIFQGIWYRIKMISTCASICVVIVFILCDEAMQQWTDYTSLILLNNNEGSILNHLLCFSNCFRFAKQSFSDLLLLFLSSFNNPAEPFLMSIVMLLHFYLRYPFITGLLTKQFLWVVFRIISRLKFCCMCLW